MLKDTYERHTKGLMEVAYLAGVGHKVDWDHP